MMNPDGTYDAIVLLQSSGQRTPSKGTFQVLPDGTMTYETRLSRGLLADAYNLGKLLRRLVLPCAIQN